MKVIVFGAGAVGSLLSARLAAAGHSVLVVARPPHAAEIRDHGLRVEGEGAGTFRCEAVDQLAPQENAEAVVLTVKTFDLSRAAAAVGRSVRPLPVLLTQNGLDIEPSTIDAFRASGWPEPDRHLVRAVHSLPATLLGPGVVRAAGTGEMVLPDAEHHPRIAGSIERFLDLLRSAGLPVRTVTDLDREVWRKVLVNAAVNPVTAVHRVPNGRLAAGPLQEEAATLLREALSVAHACGVPISDPEARDELARVVRATAENRSSMLQDVERGRPTEVDSISGELLRRAAEKGIDLPLTRNYVARLTAARSA